MTVAFPNESAGYRSARAALLEREKALRLLTAEVAARRQALPMGGAVLQDYMFDELGPDGAPRTVRLSELFTDAKSTLLIYNYMYGPQMAKPCLGCTPFLDGLEGTMPHVAQIYDFVLVAKSPIERVRAFTDPHGWTKYRILSSANNTYNRDYFGEDADGNQMPMLNVFHREPDGAIRHFWGSELLLNPPDPFPDTRHLDVLEAAWNLFDLTPEDRPDGDPFQFSYP